MMKAIDLIGKASPHAKDLATFQRWTGLMHQHIDGGYPLTPQGSLPGAALGVCGELGELVEGTGDIMVFEAGDVLSYVYIMTEVLGLDGSRWINPAHLNDPEYGYHHHRLAPQRNDRRWPAGPLGEAVINGLRIAELTKKRTIQGHPISAEKFEGPLCTLVQQVAAYLGQYGVSTKDALELNVQKLTIRYPRAAEYANEEMKLPRRVEHPQWYGIIDPGGPFQVHDRDEEEDSDG